MRIVEIICLLSLSIPTFAQGSDLNQLTFFGGSSSSSSPSTSPSSRSADVLYRLTFPTRKSTLSAREYLESTYDVWKTTAATIDVMLPTQDHNDLLNSLIKQLGATSTSILIPSVSSLLTTSPSLTSSYNRELSAAALSNWTFENRIGQATPRRSAIDSTIHDAYHPIEAIEQILIAFQNDFPGFAKRVIVGATTEGRTLWGLKVTNFAYNPQDSYSSESEDSPEIDQKKRNKKKKKKKKQASHKKHGFVVVGAQHAREWIAPASALYTIHDLLLSTLPDEPQANDGTRDLLDQIEFTFIPVLNVDGYAHTWTNNRLWRKNRQPVGSDCYGIDLNRNWPFAFSSPRPNPCSEAYPGAEPFQAPELQALSAYLTEEKNNVKGFLDLHSFGQFILFPYSYSCNHVSPDVENHFEAVVGAQKALRAVHGRTFEVGSVCEVSLTAPGGSLDWTYETAKIRWSFSIELRDQGVFGFLLPPSQIRPSGEEAAAAFKDLASYVVRKEAGGR